MPSNIQCPSNPSKFHIFRHTECHDNIILINQVNKSQSLISMLLKVVCSSHVGDFMFNCIQRFNINLRYINTKFQIADLMTKGSFTAQTFATLQKLAGLYATTQPTTPAAKLSHPPG